MDECVYVCVVCLGLCMNGLDFFVKLWRTKKKEKREERERDDDDE